MGKGRLEAFSDGVIAIIITIMVLELKVPRGADVGALVPLLPVFLAYILSFVYTAIYWNNHHHMFSLVKTVNGSILWANSHLLFWLSIVPFVTAWSGDNHFAAIPMACYGIVLFLASIAYTILQRTIVASQGADSPLASALGGDFKGKLSTGLYIAGILFALARHPAIAGAFYVTVAIIWLIPDRRIERKFANLKTLGLDPTNANPDEDENENSPKPPGAKVAPIQSRDIIETDL